MRKAQAAQTRRAIIEAALITFLEDGYAGATMQKIAGRAGVVVETIYRSFQGKAGLFTAAVEAAVAGGADRAERSVQERPAILAVIEEPDPHRKLERYAATQPGVHERLAPLYQALAEAGVADPELVGLRRGLEDQRLAGMARFALHLAESGTLRQGVTEDEARDVLWAMASHEVYKLLVIEREWSSDRYRDWLSNILISSLLP